MAAARCRWPKKTSGPPTGTPRSVRRVANARLSDVRVSAALCGGSASSTSMSGATPTGSTGGTSASAPARPRSIAAEPRARSRSCQNGSVAWPCWPARRAVQAVTAWLRWSPPRPRSRSRCSPPQRKPSFARAAAALIGAILLFTARRARARARRAGSHGRTAGVRVRLPPRRRRRPHRGDRQRDAPARRVGPPRGGGRRLLLARPLRWCSCCARRWSRAPARFRARSSSASARGSAIGPWVAAACSWRSARSTSWRRATCAAWRKRQAVGHAHGASLVGRCCRRWWRRSTSRGSDADRAAPGSGSTPPPRLRCSRSPRSRSPACRRGARWCCRCSSRRGWRSTRSTGC